jgi:hypothetical protein
MYFLPQVGLIDILSTIPAPCVVSFIGDAMFTDFERFERFIIAVALIVLVLDLFYWRP